MKVTANDLKCHDFHTQRMTDGGVFDNLGLHWLSYLKENHRNPPLDMVISSNAEAGFDPGTDEWFWGEIHRNVRANDILMNRVSAFEAELAGKDSPPVVTCKLQDTVDDEARYATRPPAQWEIGRFRTDMDRFEDFEIHALAAHGYAVARQAWEKASAKHNWEPPGDSAALSGEAWSPIPKCRGQDLVAGDEANAHSEPARPWWRIWTTGPKESGPVLLARSAKRTSGLFVLDSRNVAAMFLLLASVALTASYWWWSVSEDLARDLAYTTTECAPEDPFIQANPWLEPVYRELQQGADNKRPFRMVKITIDPGDERGAQGADEHRRRTLTYDRREYEFTGFAFCLRGSGGPPLSDAYLPIHQDAEGDWFVLPPDKIGRSIVVIGRLQKKNTEEFPPNISPIITPKR